MSILLDGCTTWMLTKHIEKKLNGNCTRMLQAMLNKSWKQHPIKQQSYSRLPPILKTIQIKQTRHMGHCWRSKDNLISDVLLWTPLYRCTSAWQPARTYLQQFCTDTGCSLGRPAGSNGWQRWMQERFKEIRTSCMTSWWWFILQLWLNRRADWVLLRQFR